MFRIGYHLSISKGYLAAAKECLSVGANTFQFFSRNPMGSKARPINEKDIASYMEYSSEHGISRILAHAPYTLNCASSKPEVREFADMCFADDLRRIDMLPGSLYNFHPGSHTGDGIKVGISRVVSALDKAITSETNTIACLETMGGKGSEIGSSFEELGQIIRESAWTEKLAVCLDTCHVFDAGYDIVNNLDGVLEEFDHAIGISKLKAIHLNDSKNALGSRKDRHEKIGEGSIGLDAFARIINHAVLSDLPFYLETPTDLEGYSHEIALLASLRDR
ncbi:MAG: deoxyribonuclease IV [Eubacteriaceae bacterium]|nr:deoxyribonuclease IV [Eubacteriaceae bacterium]